MNDSDRNSVAKLPIIQENIQYSNPHTTAAEWLRWYPCSCCLECRFPVFPTFLMCSCHTPLPPPPLICWKSFVDGPLIIHNIIPL